MFLRVMGCLLAKLGLTRKSHEELEEEPQQKQYSWDKRQAVNKEDFIVHDQKDATIGRVPGQVNGQQFLIKNCENCNIYVFDHINTVTIDDCFDCNIFLGPVKTSVYIRDCKNCKLVSACQQYRTRDCSKIDTFLCCNTQPIIESSSGMKFACYQYYYPELEAQFKASELSIFNNTWGDVYDFSRDPDETHFSLLSADSKVEDFLPIPLAESLSTVQIDLNPDKSVVPVTLGKRRKPSDESCLLVFFNDGNNYDRVVRFLEYMRVNKSGIVLVQTKEVKMEPADAERVFGTDIYASIVQQGNVIGLEYNGENSIEVIHSALEEFMKSTAGLVFVTENRNEVDKQIENFYNFADMRMAV